MREAAVEGVECVKCVLAGAGVVLGRGRRWLRRDKRHVDGISVEMVLGACRRLGMRGMQGAMMVRRWHPWGYKDAMDYT